MENNSREPHRMTGNKYGLKLKEPDIRQEAFKQFCEHLSSGNPKESFYFKHPEHSVCWKTMERYIRENPEEFPAILIEEAKALRYQHWFNEGKALMQGAYKGGSPVVWQTIMRNIFRSEGWDREILEQDNKSHVERLASGIRSETIAEAEGSDSPVEQ